MQVHYIFYFVFIFLFQQFVAGSHSRYFCDITLFLMIFSFCTCFQQCFFFRVCRYFFYVLQQITFKIGFSLFKYLLFCRDIRFSVQIFRIDHVRRFHNRFQKVHYQGRRKATNDMALQGSAAKEDPRTVTSTTIF